MIMKLNFSPANIKLKVLEKLTGKKVYSFSLLSAHTCPGAKDCQSFAIETPQGVRIRDGKHTKFRCFSASQEVLFPNVYKSRKENMNILPLAAQSIKQAAEIIVDNIPKKAGIIRIHVGGDFKTLAYFDTWNTVARMMPDINFYAYTKSIPFWVKRLGLIPNNLILTASIGGKYDDVAIQNGLRTATVYETIDDVPPGIEHDEDDSHAALPELRDISFGLLLHGTQKGRKAKHGYSKNRKKVGA
jgi:hypothetical protein